jgi:glycosyltransferase involved in cell wall biosynthesis
VQKLCIIIPAYNEQERIARTLTAYADYYAQLNERYVITLLVVLNGCVDNTRTVVKQIAREKPMVSCIEIKAAGKGRAIKVGFQHALQEGYDLIGYVDADMATRPEQYYELIKAIPNVDGVIASRYMPGAQVYPARPWIKRWGSKFVYEPLVYLLFGLRYWDYQCGAKLFKRQVIEKVVMHLTVTQWAFDVELLYWCKKLSFSVIEVPTIWRDQAGSKLAIFGSGYSMLTALVALWWQIQHHKSGE